MRICRPLKPLEGPSTRLRYGTGSALFVKEEDDEDDNDDDDDGEEEEELKEELEEAAPTAACAGDHEAEEKENAEAAEDAQNVWYSFHSVHSCGYTTLRSLLSKYTGHADVTGRERNTFFPLRFARSSPFAAAIFHCVLTYQTPAALHRAPKTCTSRAGRIPL